MGLAVLFNQCSILFGKCVCQQQIVHAYLTSGAIPLNFAEDFRPQTPVQKLRHCITWQSYVSALLTPTTSFNSLLRRLHDCCELRHRSIIYLAALLLP